MKHLESITVDAAKLDLTLESLYPYCGYGHHQPKGAVLTLLQEMLDEAKAVAVPDFGYVVVEGEAVGKDSFRLGNETFAPGAVITHALKGCSQYILLVATVGEAFDNWLQTIHQEGDILRMYLSDAVGSAMAEATQRYAVAYLEREAAKEGLYITNDYSPGYCGWHVKEQQLFFALLPNHFCGVTLSESSLMHPIKSISCVIGLDEHAVKRPYGCDICRKTDCFLKIARAKNNIQ